MCGLLKRTYDYIIDAEYTDKTPYCKPWIQKRGCEYIGIPVKTMHKIRKTYASQIYHSCHNISAVKDVLGHADETTTLKHYIYNTEDNEETDRLIRNALEDNCYHNNKKGTSRDLNIILFPPKKKTENSVSTKFSAR